jgi:hypothetical protein
MKKESVKGKEEGNWEIEGWKEREKGKGII